MNQVSGNHTRGRKRARPRTVWGLLVALTSCLAVSEIRAEFFCPEEGDPYEVDATGKKTMRPFKDSKTDINGDKGNDVLGDSFPDGKGNMVECWCVQKGATAQQFFYAFVPIGGGGRKWFGGCYYSGGKNFINPNGEKDKTGQFKEYETITQTNIEYAWDPVKKAPTGTRDRHFEYYNSGPNKGKRRVVDTEGVWEKNGVGANGDIEWKYKIIKTTPGEFVDPPVDPKDILASNVTDDHSGVHGPMAEVFASITALPRYDYSLLPMPPVDLSPLIPDSAGNVAVWEVHITTGDTWTIAGLGIGSPFVIGEAALAANGGWQVLEFDSGYVTYRATQTVSLNYDHPIAGFGFFSQEPPGSVRWVYAGAEIGEAGTTTGPSLGSGRAVPVLSPGGIVVLCALLLATSGLLVYRRAAAG